MPIISPYAQVTDSAGSMLSIIRDYKMAARELLPPGGQRCPITMDSMGQLASFVGVDNSTTRFSYVGNSGLIESKENSLGQTYVYEYDNYGRLSYVIQPTGDRVSIDNENSFGQLLACLLLSDIRNGWNVFVSDTCDVTYVEEKATPGIRENFTRTLVLYRRDCSNGVI